MENFKLQCERDLEKRLSDFRTEFTETAELTERKLELEWKKNTIEIREHEQLMEKQSQSYENRINEFAALHKDEMDRLEQIIARTPAPVITDERPHRLENDLKAAESTNYELRRQVLEQGASVKLISGKNDALRI